MSLDGYIYSVIIRHRLTTIMKKFKYWNFSTVKSTRKRNFFIQSVFPCIKEKLKKILSRKILFCWPVKPTVSCPKFPPAFYRPGSQHRPLIQPFLPESFFNRSLFRRAQIQTLYPFQSLQNPLLFLNSSGSTVKWLYNCFGL